MANTVLLPAPLAPGSIRIGQLLTDPLNPEIDSFINENDSLPLRAPTAQTDFKQCISRDDNGRFVGTLHGQLYSPNNTTILVEADQLCFTTLRDPLSAFRYTSRRASSQSFLHKAAIRRQPMYFVTAIQRLSNPRFIYQDPNSFQKPQIHRQDSSVSLNVQTGDFVLAVELRKVTCRIGSPEEPQLPEDAGFAWKHYRLQGEHDLQLAVGLGPPVDADEFATLVDVSSDADYTNESADSEDFDFEFDDDEEMGGCCSACMVNSSYRRF